MPRLFQFGLALGALAFTAVGVLDADSARSGRRFAVQVRLDDETINPPVARFIDRAIRQAEEQRAECLIIVLDTPGGLVDSTRDIVKSILRSRVPIVVYVAPQGARAASAGVFITMSAHVAAMAPGTNIGAAHPVQIGGLPSQPKNDKEGKPAPIEEKILNDTAAWARSLAELRGRNAEWAERTVRESISVPASEAVRENAVDLLADDLSDLLEKLDGRQVETPDGPVRLRTAGIEIRTLEMWWGERLLGVLANPNLAFLLLLFGFYGILFELYTPGWGVAGTLGIIFLVMGFFALAILPINYVGLALIIVALGLFVAEAFVTSYGFLTIGGVICLILGGVMLVDSPIGFQRVSLWLLIPIALATAAVTLFLVGSIVRVHRRRVQSGQEGLVGAQGVAIEDFAPDGARHAGMVRAHGELWRGTCQTPIKAGQAVRIDGREGLVLHVQLVASAPEPATVG